MDLLQNSAHVSLSICSALFTVFGTQIPNLWEGFHYSLATFTMIQYNLFTTYLTHQWKAGSISILSLISYYSNYIWVEAFTVFGTQIPNLWEGFQYLLATFPMMWYHIFTTYLNHQWKDSSLSILSLISYYSNSSWVEAFTVFGTRIPNLWEVFQYLLSNFPMMLSYLFTTYLTHQCKACSLSILSLIS